VFEIIRKKGKFRVYDLVNDNYVAYSQYKKVAEKESRDLMKKKGFAGEIPSFFYNNDFNEINLDNANRD
jgi:hypothetical protein